MVDALAPAGVLDPSADPYHLQGLTWDPVTMSLRAPTKPTPSTPPAAAAGANPIDLVSAAILGQESGNNSNVGASVSGATGPGQIEPGTFAQYARPGESISDPNANRAVHRRIIEDYMRRYNGDTARVAVAYFSGPGNVAPAGSPTPYIRNAADGNGKTTASYAQDVSGRIAKMGGKLPLGAAQVATNGAQPAQAEQPAPTQDPAEQNASKEASADAAPLASGSKALEPDQQQAPLTPSLSISAPAPIALKTTPELYLELLKRQPAAA